MTAAETAGSDRTAGPTNSTAAVTVLRLSPLFVQQKLPQVCTMHNLHTQQIPLSPPPSHHTASVAIHNPCLRLKTATQSRQQPSPPPPPRPSTTAATATVAAAAAATVHHRRHRRQRPQLTRKFVPFGLSAVVDGRDSAAISAICVRSGVCGRECDCGRSRHALRIQPSWH